MKPAAPAMRASSRGVDAPEDEHHHEGEEDEDRRDRGQPRRAREAGRRTLEHPEGVLRDVVDVRRLQVARAVGRPPGRVEQQRRPGDHREAAPGPQQPELDEADGRERHAQRRAGQGDPQQDRREDVPAARPPVQGQEHPEARGHGADEAELERPHEVVARRAEDDDERRGGQRGTLAGPFAHQRVEQDDREQVDEDERDAVGPVVPEAGRLQQDLVDRHRDDGEVAVVRPEQRIRGHPAAPQDEVPLVEEERAVAPRVQHEGAAEQQDEGQRELVRACAQRSAVICQRPSARVNP